MVYVVHPNSHSQAESPEKQWEKANRNFYGYLDIYRHMLEVIIQDLEERAYYENRVDSWQYRHESQNAVRKQDKAGLRKSYTLLLSTGWATLGDKIAFNSVLNPVKAFFYKVCRRLNVGKENDS